MFLGAQGSAVFSGKDAKAILALMADQGKASRSAYQAIQQKLDGKELRDHLKTQGHGKIGVRYLESAISSVEGLAERPNVLFGGKENWQKLLKGEISKSEWHRRRNNRLFARGDKSKQGNPLIRLKDGKLWVLIPSGAGARGTWIQSERLRLFQEIPPHALSCYNMRLIHTKGRKFDVQISWQMPELVSPITPANGVIGVDTNPNLLAGIETNKDGNPISRLSIDLPRVMDAKTPKREADIFLAAKNLVDWALAKAKPIAIEDLRFGKKTKRPKGKRRNRKFNRMQCGWAYRKLLEAIERRATKLGVPVIKVPPGYSSVLGIAKFSEMYNFSRHHAAALILARRGQGIKTERQNFVVVTTKKTKKENKPKEPRGGADTEREAIRPPRKQPTPAKKTRTVRLSELSFSRLRSQYLRGAGIPQRKCAVEKPKTVGLHGPPSRSGLNTRHHRGTRGGKVHSPLSMTDSLGASRLPVNQSKQV